MKYESSMVISKRNGYQKEDKVNMMIMMERRSFDDEGK